MPYDGAREWLGEEMAREFWALTESYLERLGRSVGDALRHVGSLRLAADEEERDELRREHEALQADGFETEWREPLRAPLTGASERRSSIRPMPPFNPHR
jgi:gamma-glutamylputrescine oxidase